MSVNVPQWWKVKATKEQIASWKPCLIQILKTPSYVHCLVTDLWNPSVQTYIFWTFCFQSAGQVYIVIYYNVSSVNLLLCFVQYFLTQNHPPPCLWPSHMFSILFCPSGVWDIRHCWEAYGLLIKKQGRMRPQLTRTDVCKALLVWIYKQSPPSSVANTCPEPAQIVL